MLLDVTPSPDWLKYGFPGLILVFTVLTWFVFKPVTQQPVKQKRWILPFIAVSLIFLSMSSVYVYHAGKRQNIPSPEADSLREQLQDYQNKVSDLTGKIPEAELLTSKISESKRQYDSLGRINEKLKDSLGYIHGIIDELAKTAIVETLNNDLIATEGKKKWENKIPDVRYKRLKRAVFFNMLVFHADVNILKTTLKALQNETTEYTEADVNRVIDDFNALRDLRLTWLKEQAIPALQHLPSAQVKLPPQIILLETDDARGSDVYRVTNIANLKKEQDLLAHPLAN